MSGEEVVEIVERLDRLIELGVWAVVGLALIAFVAGVWLGRSTWS